MLKSFFENEKIEYFCVLPYSMCRETSPAIMARESFKPESVIVFLIPYYTGDTVNISRYAASLDYHIYIKEISERLIKLLSEKYPEYSFRGYGDHSPIDERLAAVHAGLGIFGDNGLLINEKYGSYVFIADLVTDIPPNLLSAIEKPFPIKTCTHCGACKRACPTGILAGRGCDCLSAITQKKGELSESEQALMLKHGTVWGCDECQSVCPHNKNPKMTPVEFFYRDRIEKLTPELFFEMTDFEFKRRAFGWRGRRTVERNLEIFKE